jgi:hypothetical protein
MRAGKIDESPLIQAFARHRIASTLPAGEGTVRFCRAERIDQSASPPVDYDEARGEAWIAGYAAAIEIVHDHALLNQSTDMQGEGVRARAKAALEMADKIVTVRGSSDQGGMSLPSGLSGEGVSEAVSTSYVLDHTA